jgi:hypothetical protein
MVRVDMTGEVRRMERIRNEWAAGGEERREKRVVVCNGPKRKPSTGSKA